MHVHHVVLRASDTAPFTSLGCSTKPRSHTPTKGRSPPFGHFHQTSLRDPLNAMQNGKQARYDKTQRSRGVLGIGVVSWSRVVGRKTYEAHNKPHNTSTLILTPLCCSGMAQGTCPELRSGLKPSRDINITLFSMDHTIYHLASTAVLLTQL